jgi:hypothetical protein
LTSFATLPADERAEILGEAALRLRAATLIVEKDFCWMLARVFGNRSFGTEVVFKGGTSSLSKVFGAIDRFSEDVDLCLPPGSLGIRGTGPGRSAEPDPAREEGEAPARGLLPLSRARAPKRAGGVGPRASGCPDRTIELARLRIRCLHRILLDYPAVERPSGSYIAPQVKIEIGSLTDQRPFGAHAVEALVARAAPGSFDDVRTEVVALEIERTFWEKATILHAEYHRPADKTLRDLRPGPATRPPCLAPCVWLHLRRGCASWLATARAWSRCSSALLFPSIT